VVLRLRPAVPFAVLVALVALAVVTPTRNASAEVRVTRADDAAECPDAAAFDKRLRDDVNVDRNARTILVHFERGPNGYRASVRTAEGMQRSLHDPSCDALAEAALLTVKLALEAPAPSVLPEQPDAPSVDARDAREPVLPRPRTTARGGEVRVAAVLAVGVGSPSAPGFRAGVATTFAPSARWSASAGITGLVLATQTRSLGTGEVDISVAGGGVEGCVRHRISFLLRGAACARGELLRLGGSARGFAHSESDARALWLGTLAARGETRIRGPLGVYIEAAALVPVVRERFEITRVGLVTDPPPVGATLSFGVVVDFE
jgi:hypothetical protein